MTDILDTMAPVKKFQVRSKYSAWLSEATQKKIKERDQAQQASAFSGSEEDWSRYKKLRNDLTKILRTEKTSWQQSKLQSCEDKLETGKLWKNILGGLNSFSTSSPTKLMHNGDMKTSPHMMADEQNEYYIDKVKEISKV